MNKIFIIREKLILVSLASFQVLINFFINFLIVKKIGFGNELDIYYIAMAVFSFLSTSIGWSISSVLTPILIEHRNKKIEGNMFINVLIITVVSTLFSSLVIVYAYKYLYFNYLENISNKEILIIQFLFMGTFFFNTINIVFISIFQEKNLYVALNLLYVITTGIGFAFVYLTIDSLGIYSAGLNQLVIQLSLFIILFIKTYSIIRKSIFFDKDNLILLWNRMKYLLFGSFYYRTDELVERFIASYLTGGFLSLVAFTQRVYGAIVNVLNMSIAGPTITKFSNLVMKQDRDGMKIILYRYLMILFIIDFIVFIFIVLFGKSLFTMFFIDKIPPALLPYLPVVIFCLFVIVFSRTLGQVLHKFLLSVKVEKQITLFDICSFTISIILKSSLTYMYGMYGFLFAIVFSEIIYLFMKSLLYLIVIKKYDFI